VKRVLFLVVSIFLLAGCGKVSKDNLIDSFKDDVESSKSYYVEAKMEIYNSEDTFTYNMKVYYMDDDLFKVNMLNTINNHEQIILRDSESVYVVTPSLNKSYKFMSEWPYNSSQAYILNSLIKDIDNDSEIEFVTGDNEYALVVNVNYPNNPNLKYEKIIFDKDKKLKSVLVYDDSDVVCIKVQFNKIDYKANLGDKEFDIEEISVFNGGNETTNSSLDDIIYPLYVPSNTYLHDKQTINTENGKRVILTFNGDRNFVLIEEETALQDEFVTVPVYGDPLMLSNTIGALSSNSLSWTSNYVDYYLAGNDLSTEELLTIADSLNLNNTTVYYEK